MSGLCLPQPACVGMCRATFDTDNIDVGPERRAYLDHRLSRVWEVNSQVMHWSSCKHCTDYAFKCREASGCPGHMMHSSCCGHSQPALPLKFVSAHPSTDKGSCCCIGMPYVHSLTATCLAHKHLPGTPSSSPTSTAFPYATAFVPCAAWPYCVMSGTPDTQGMLQCQ